MKHEEIVVTHGDLRRRCIRLGVHHGRVGHPGLTCILKMLLHTPPFVPGQEAIKTDKEKGQENDYDHSDFRNLNKVASDVVDD